MNTENGSPTCDACHTDCNDEDLYSVDIHWDPDTDYNTLHMCPDCTILYSWKAKEIRNPLGKLIIPQLPIWRKKGGNSIDHRASSCLLD